LNLQTMTKIAFVWQAESLTHGSSADDHGAMTSSQVPGPRLVAGRMQKLS
jgi:hypothetical protein